MEENARYVSSRGRSGNNRDGSLLTQRNSAILLVSREVMGLNQERMRQVKVPLCKVEEIPEDGTKTVEFFGREVLVMKVGGIPKAIANVCMHLGGPLQRDNDKLICSWHGAEYACVDGRRLKGPARKDSQLMFLPTRIEDGTLKYVYGE